MPKSKNIKGVGRPLRRNGVLEKRMNSMNGFEVGCKGYDSFGCSPIQAPDTLLLNSGFIL